MNVILQNVVAAVSGISLTVGGLIGMESRYLDEGEATSIYQSKIISQQQYIAQLAVNTSVAATLIDLRIRQYQYTAEHTESPVERDAMLGEMRIAEAELRKLGETYDRAINLMPIHFGSISSGN